MAPGKLETHRQKSETRSNLSLYAKDNLEWIKNLNIKCETTKFLGKNTREIFQDIGIGKDCFGYDPPSTSNKGKNRQRDYIKLSNFAMRRKKLHDEAINREKTFAMFNK